MAIPSNPSTELYTLGKGILYIAEWSGGAPGAYVDVGNCPRFEVEVTEETLDHYSSRSGTRTKDKQVILETGYNVEFDLDEMSVNNLKRFIKATVSATGHILYANQDLAKEYALKFVSDNAEGPNQTWYFWRIKLSPGGAFSLISDDFTVLTFTGEGLTDTTNHPSSPYFDIWFVTTTTTSTSTSSSSSTSSTASTASTTSSTSSTASSTSTTSIP